TSTTDVTTIPTPATSLLVYNTNAAMTGGAVGYWYYDGTQWVQALGPQGPAGPAGATGPQGPPGPTWNITSNQFNANGTVTITTDQPSTFTTTAGAWLTTGNNPVGTNDFMGSINAADVKFRTTN